MFYFPFCNVYFNTPSPNLQILLPFLQVSLQCPILYEKISKKLKKKNSNLKDMRSEVNREMNIKRSMKKARGKVDRRTV